MGTWLLHSKSCFEDRPTDRQTRRGLDASSRSIKTKGICLCIWFCFPPIKPTVIGNLFSASTEDRFCQAQLQLANSLEIELS